MQPIDNTKRGENAAAPKNDRFPFGVLWVLVLGILISFRIFFYLGRDFNDTPSKFTFITTSVLNVLILAAIVVQALIYYFQWAAMAKQGDLMNESLIETRKSADAAKASADIADTTMKLAHYGYLEMVDWKIEIEGDSAIYTNGTTQITRPRELHISCRIINAGNIPATIDTIETNWGEQGVTVRHNATVILLSVGYAYRHTINFDSTPSLKFTGNTQFGGRITGGVRYAHFFGRRVRRFDQLFSFSQATNECRIAPNEGPGNNDEPDSEPDPGEEQRPN
jgi:hypothetical protein